MDSIGGGRSSERWTDCQKAQRSNASGLVSAAAAAAVVDDDDVDDDSWDSGPHRLLHSFCRLERPTFEDYTPGLKSSSPIPNQNRHHDAVAAAADDDAVAVVAADVADDGEHDY